LVEQSALGCVSLEIGGLDVVGEIKSKVEDLERLVVLDFVAAEKLLGRGALAADACLFLGEYVVADRVVVVVVEELALFVVEAGDFGAGAGRFLLGDRDECLDVVLDAVSDAVALRLGELDGGVVAFDCGFDCFGAVVVLVADAGVSAAADEVVVESAVASAGAGEVEAVAAFGAVEASAQVVVVAPAALA
jgi:hypothetical protein